MTQTQVHKPMQASKWLKVQALLDPEEMAALFEHLNVFSLYFTGCVTSVGEEELTRRAFLDAYYDYISVLREGREPDLTVYRSMFSSVMTCNKDMVYAVPATEGKQVMRVAKPVVQMQAHTMGYSPVDGKFRSMVLGKEAISWGIQFSYPQLFQDPDTSDIISVVETEAFPNTHLFRSLQKWMRTETIPTPVIVNGVAINLPIRLGKKCLSWIDQHVQLIEKGITIDAR